MRNGSIACLGCILVTTWILGSPLHGAPTSGQIVFTGRNGAPGKALTGDRIPASLGEWGGGGKKNLFHSFSRFNVESGKTITFEAPQVTRNILARVTGSDPSNINGTIATEGTNTNLYLMNPNGIIFGKGASINVAGSFTATTADYIAFEDKNGVRARFWASESGDTTLVSHPPSSFGFLPPDANSVPSGEYDGLVKISSPDLVQDEFYDDVTEDFKTDPQSGFRVAATEVVVGGQTAIGCDDTGIQFVALEFGEAHLGKKRFELSKDSEGGAISVKDSRIRSKVGGSVSLVTPGSITVSDSGLVVEIPESDEAGGWDAGFVLQAGGDLTIKGNSDVMLNAMRDHSVGSIVLSAGGDLKLEGNVGVNQTLKGKGSSGAVFLSSGGDIALTGTSGVSQSNESTGDAVTMLGQGGSSPPERLADGIMLSAGRSLLISDFAAISTEATASGPGGDIEVFAKSLVISGPDRATGVVREFSTGIETITSSAARGGDIRVSVDGSIEIRQAGGIYASTNDSGDSGSICVKGRELEIVGARNYSKAEIAQKSGISPKNFFITGISNKGALSNTTGNLGSTTVSIEGAIVLKRGGLIDGTNFSRKPSSISGDVTVKSSSIIADRGNSVYFTGIGSGTVNDIPGSDVAGEGGTITVRSGSVRLLNGAQIAASSRNGGDAGNVRLFTNDLFASGTGERTDFLFTGESGVVAATLGSSTGDGGSVQIHEWKGEPVASGTPRIRLADGAEITARSDGAGQGGSVRINFRDGRILLDSDAGISARSGKLGGDAGSVRLVARIVDVTCGASISSEAISEEKGTAGSVVLFPGELTVDDDGSLKVSAAGGDAGDLKIKGASLLDFQNAKLSAEAAGNGGNVLVTGARYLLLDHSRVNADATKDGNGGNINLQAGVILDNGSTITASSRFGTDGIVRIDPQVALSGAEGQEDPEPLDVTDSLQPECTNRIATKSGSFIRAGRGGIARLPGGYLPSMRLFGRPRTD